jgi:hypothetical protein
MKWPSRLASSSVVKSCSIFTRLKPVRHLDIHLGGQANPLSLEASCRPEWAGVSLLSASPQINQQ